MDEIKSIEKLYNDLKKSNGDAHKIEDKRALLRDSYELIILGDISRTVRSSIENKLWITCYYTPIQERKKNGEDIKKLIDEASGLFHSLVRQISSKIDSKKIIIDVKQPERILCYRLFVYLGDLCRYRESDENDKGYYETAKNYYRQAALIAPSESRSRNQLAFIASAQADHLEAIFQFSLSSCCLNKLQLAALNLTSFYKTREQKQMIDYRTKAIELFLKFHQDFVLPPIDTSLERRVAVYNEILENLSELINEADCPQIFLKMMTVMMFAAHDFTQAPVERQGEEVFQLQVLAISLIFDIVYLSIKTDNLKFLSPIKLFCDWLISNPKFMGNHLKSDEYFPASSQSAQGFQFWESISSFYNKYHLSLSHNIPHICLEEDIQVLGFLPLLPTQEKLEFTQGEMIKLLPSPICRIQISNAIKEKVQFKSLTNLMKLALSEGFVDFENEGYAAKKILSEASRITERREKTMKKMAQARLQASIGELEATLTTAKQSEIPTRILIVDCASLLYYLKQIKEIRLLHNHLLIVPLIVIYQLDDLKKGNEVINFYAREAIRFLEESFKLNSKWIRSQSEKEFFEFPLKTKDPSSQISKEEKQILECCMYFMTNYEPGRVLLLVGDENFEQLSEYNSIKSQRTSTWIKSSLPHKMQHSGKHKQNKTK